MKLKSHTSDSSFSWIKDSISVSVSDLSSAEIVLKFSDFSVTAFSSFSFLARDPETKEEVSVPFIQLSPDTFRLNLSVFHEFICFKRNYTLILTLNCITFDNQNLLYSLHPDGNLNMDYHIFINDIYFPEDTSPEPNEYIGILTAGFDNLLIIRLCSRKFFMENLLICAYHKLKITHGILKVSFDLEQSRHKYIKTGLFFPQ